MTTSITVRTRVYTLRDLRQAANDRRSVVCPSHRAWSRRSPAAFIMNLQGTVLVRMLDAGVYLCPKPERKRNAFKIPKAGT